MQLVESALLEGIGMQSTPFSRGWQKVVGILGGPIKLYPNMYWNCGMPS
jgi:hypothetical protein